MKIKTSITLSEALLATLDKWRDDGTSRSQLIENVLREYAVKRLRAERDARDVEIINANAAYFNAESEDFRPSARDPKRQRVVVVVSRSRFIATTFDSVICAPVYTRYEGLSTQVPVGIDEGLKHPSGIYCDELFSIQKVLLTNFIGSLSPAKIPALNRALLIALELEDAFPASIEPRNGNL
jgi:mRNA interferase MazF